MDRLGTKSPFTTGGANRVVLLAIAILLWILLPWVPIAETVLGDDKQRRIRFTSQTLLVFTAAMVVAVAARIPTVVSGLLCALAYGHTGWFWIRSRRHRWPTTAVLACMVLHFLRLLFLDVLIAPINLVTVISWMAAGLPAFLPSALFGSLLGQNLHDISWLGVLLSAAELELGLWLIRLGPRRGVAYLVLVLLISI